MKKIAIFVKKLETMVEVTKIFGLRKAASTHDTINTTAALTS